MSIANIHYFADLVRTPRGGWLPSGFDSQGGEDLAVSASQVESPPAPERAAIFRVVSTVDIRLAIGTEPDASAEGALLIGAGRTEYFGIKPGQKVAVVGAI
jgi:hypothetical protein